MSELYMLVQHIDDVELEYSGQSNPDPIVVKVLNDIAGYRDDQCDIWIGERLFAYESGRMWPIEALRGKWELTYDENGEYYENE